MYENMSKNDIFKAKCDYTLCEYFGKTEHSHVFFTNLAVMYIGGFSVCKLC